MVRERKLNPGVKEKEGIMKQNVGSADKLIRIILGIVILALGFIFKSWWGIIGIIPLLTGLVGWCGLYTLLGISTCKIKAPQQS
jgi:predicted RND superfamily exporter protein